MVLAGEAGSAGGIALGEWVLIGITVVYVVFTIRLYLEQRRMRVESQQPRLKLRFHALSPVVVLPEVINAGGGPARDARLTLRFEPRDAKSAEVDVRQWREAALLPGEFTRLLPPDVKPRDLVTFQELGERYRTVRLEGTYWDVFDVKHTIHDAVEDLAGWQATLRSAHIHYVTDWEDQRRRDVEKIRKALEQIAKKLDR